MYSRNINLAGKYSHLLPQFSAGLTWLSQTDISSLPVGKLQIPGTDLIADVQSYTTKPAEECRLESHNEHFDIQFIAEGREFFAVCPSEGLAVIEAHPERDTYFHEKPGIYSSILMNAGDFIILAPGEGHASKEMVSGPENVRKVIIKVKA